MRLGVNLGYWGLGLTSADQLALALEAEAAGFDSLWTAEAYGSDAATPLAWFAAQTERIKLGAAILQMPGRSPAMTAMTAVTLDHLSNGRFLLGIGTSGPQVAEGWHGQRFGKQLARTREYFPKRPRSVEVREERGCVAIQPDAKREAVQEDEGLGVDRKPAFPGSDPLL